MPDIHLVFDVNETLLDLAPLDEVFTALFDDATLRRTWFADLLHWSTVTTLTGDYRDFTRLAGDCLTALADQRGVELTHAKRQRVFDTIAALPPHDDVADALARVKSHGFKLVALTNSAQKTVDAQFEHTGLAAYFDHVLSVDAARCFKPHPNAYALPAGTLGCANAACCLIAAHHWDVTGAMRAGYRGALVTRGDAVIHPAGQQPDIVGRGLADVADQLIEAHA